MNKRNIAKLVLMIACSVILSACVSVKEDKEVLEDYSDFHSFPPGSPKAALADQMAPFGPWIHDPSTLWVQDGYWMTLSSGYNTDYIRRKLNSGFGINSWYRDPDTGEWKLADIIFTGDDMPEWWNKVEHKGTFWAPDVPHAGVMYYSLEPDDDANSVIGRAVSSGTAPNLKWEDDGIVVFMPNCRTNGTDCPVAIDPSVFYDDKGDLYMAFGSGTSGIWIVELDSETGHLTEKAAEGWSEDNEDWHHVAYRDIEEDYIEAAFAYRHPSNGYYYLFVNWGGCCQGLRSTYNIRVGRSKSPTGPFIDKGGKDLVDQGGSLVIETKGRYIGPGHAGIYDHTDGRSAFSFHYYDGEDEGKARIAVRNLRWVDDWPVVEETDFFE